MTAGPDLIETVLPALSNSHARLAAIVGPLTPGEVTGPSYDDDWTIAQVLSHIGSGAEIFGLLLDAGLRGEPAPGMEQFQQVWDRWNARIPPDQARDAITADAAFVDRLSALDPAQRSQWRLSFFGDDRDLGFVTRMRLSEHALHTWDVAVVRDGKATVAEDAIELIIDTLPELAARAGQATGENLRVHVTTDSPERHFELTASPDGVRLSPAGPSPAAGSAVLRLPAEAFVRLVYGRLDPEHMTPAETEDVDLDTLRRLFPGV